MTYAEKLRDPRWQKRRAKILERDDYTCLECGDKKTTLNVHHGCYLPGRDPWEYPDSVLHTLCEPCHERTQAYLGVVHVVTLERYGTGDPKAASRLKNLRQLAVVLREEMAKEAVQQ